LYLAKWLFSLLIISLIIFDELSDLILAKYKLDFKLVVSIVISFVLGDNNTFLPNNQTHIE